MGQSLSFSLTITLFVSVFRSSRIFWQIKVALVLLIWLILWIPKVAVTALQWLFDPDAVIFHLPRVARQSASDVIGDKPRIALTIDDCPALEFDQRPAEVCSTMEIFRLLRSFRAKATWFVIGSHICNDRKALLQELVADGHELGNHGMYDRPAWAL